MEEGKSVFSGVRQLVKCMSQKEDVPIIIQADSEDPSGLSLAFFIVLTLIYAYLSYIYE